MDRENKMNSRQELLSNLKSEKWIKSQISKTQRFYIKQNHKIKLFLKALNFLQRNESESLFEQQDELSSLSLRSNSNSSLSSSTQNGSFISKIKCPQNLKTFYIGLSFWINILLLSVKILSSVYSYSLSVIASTIDSLLDIVSGSILYVIEICKKRGTIYKFPQGKSRLEPIGVVVFSVTMAMISLQLLKTGIEFAIQDFSANPHTIYFNSFSIISFSTTLVIKVALLCFGKYIGFRIYSPAVNALNKDHLNDLMTNSIGLMAYAIAHYYPNLVAFDSFGMIILALATISVWIKSALEQINKIVGKSAPESFISLIVFMAANFHTDICQVDKVLAYHFGTRFLVEVDIVLPPDYPLSRAHDIGEALEVLIERLSQVERAFVHLDFETAHKPEHRAHF